MSHEEILGRKMKTLISTTILFTCFAFNSYAFALTSAEWTQKFNSLAPGMSRLQVEKVIEKVRGIPSKYDLYAMDIEKYVTYKLDKKTILLVIYKPGIPAAHASGGDGGHPPQDGELIEFEILLVR